MIGNELIFDEFNVDPTWEANKTITTAEAVTRLVGFDDAPQINLTELKKGNRMKICRIDPRL